jgi:hypothetical protein
LPGTFFAGEEKFPLAIGIVSHLGNDPLVIQPIIHLVGLVPGPTTHGRHLVQAVGGIHVNLPAIGRRLHLLRLPFAGHQVRFPLADTEGITMSGTAATGTPAQAYHHQQPPSEPPPFHDPYPLSLMLLERSSLYTQAISRETLISGRFSSTINRVSKNLNVVWNFV